jgi:hypothetical protein
MFWPLPLFSTDFPFFHFPSTGLEYRFLDDWFLEHCAARGRVETIFAALYLQALEHNGSCTQLRR